ncbi:hypothetical protein QBC39DRAFT_427348 [Podospora conica]|nr:hypothetical protein QBC39DRAFT_427348 [Schizothecium conicum]
MATSDEVDRPDNPDDVRAQVLQTTIAEIASNRRGTTKPEGDSDGDGTTKAKSDDGDGDDTSDPDPCVICLEEISEACCALPCGHTNFDFLCLVSWLERHATCPLCKAPILKVRHHDTDGTERLYPVPPPVDNTPSRVSNGSGIRPRTLPVFQPSAPPISPRSAVAIEYRRWVYHQNLYSMHIGTNPHSRYRLPPTPASFNSSPHLVSRARLWIRRELQVFSYLHPDPDPGPDPDAPSSSSRDPRPARRRRDTAEFLLEYIVAILKTVDVQGSAGEASAMLADFLGPEHAPLFWHELRSWLRSPVGTLAAWDREVRYPDAAGRGRKRRGEGEEEGEEWEDGRGGQHWRPGGSSTSGGRREKRRRRDGDGRVEAGE